MWFYQEQFTGNWKMTLIDFEKSVLFLICILKEIVWLNFRRLLTHFIDLKWRSVHLMHDLNLKAFESFAANILNTTHSHLSVKCLSIQCIASTCILKWVAWRLEVNCLLLSLSAIDWLLTMYSVEVFYSCTCTISCVFLVDVLMPVWNHKKATWIMFTYI